MKDQRTLCPFGKHTTLNDYNRLFVYVRRCSYTRIHILFLLEQVVIICSGFVEM